MINVVTIENNCLKDNFIFDDVNKAEAKFSELVIVNGGTQEDADDYALEDGYYDGSNGVTVCISWPENEERDN